MIRRIDRALKRLYGLKTPMRAESFLLAQRPSTASDEAPGVVYFRADALESIRIGIYFSPPLAAKLDQLQSSTRGGLSSSQLNPFSVAVEEVSHFHYLLHHAVGTGRSVSRVELEAQGEIDKFMLAYFAMGNDETGIARFDSLFESLFERFGWSAGLDERQRENYNEANQLARSFILSLRPLLKGQVPSADRMLRQLRHFYALSQLDKERFVKKAS